MRCTLQGRSFELRRNSRALGIVRSMTSGLSINGCAHSKNHCDERKQDSLVQTFGLRRPQRFDAIQAPPPFLHLYQDKDKKEALLAGRRSTYCDSTEKKIVLWEHMSVYWQWIVCTLLSINNRDIDALSWQVTTVYLLKNVQQKLRTCKTTTSKPIALWTEYVVWVLFLSFFLYLFIYVLTYLLFAMQHVFPVGTFTALGQMQCAYDTNNESLQWQFRYKKKKKTCKKIYFTQLGWHMTQSEKKNAQPQIRPFLNNALWTRVVTRTK